MNRFILFTIVAFSAFYGNAQTQQDSVFTQFLSGLSAVDCLENLDSAQFIDLFDADKIYVNNHTVSIAERKNNTVTIDVFEFCNAYKTISVHYYSALEGEYMFVYRKFADSREEYGALQLYQKVNDEWEFGQRLTFDWHHFFNISEKEVERLRESNQSPKYLVEFRQEGIQLDIPWELYSFGEGSEINSYVTSNGKQPILLPYGSVIK
ncbi:MAG: hypothetical protein ACQERC_07705 [Bacteroidota bacterium]